MDNDVFEEEAPNEELDMAGKELKRRLESIKTTAFHESFEPAKERSLQRAFDTGYGLIYRYFKAISMLEAVYDGAYHSFVESRRKEQAAKKQFEDIKPSFAALYSELFEEFSQKIDFEKGAPVVDESYQPTSHIVPSAEVTEKFNCARAKTLDLCTRAELNSLRAVVEGIHLPLEGATDDLSLR